MNNSPKKISGPGCLLIVDGQESRTHLLGSVLHKFGFEILEASNWNQALQHLNARQPDMILLNLFEPQMEAFKICRMVRENANWSEIPIIFLSVINDKNVIVEALELGAVDYIVAPFHKRELLARLHTHLMLSSARIHARQISQDKDELLGMISHYLQNHLAGIHMSAQFLLDRNGRNEDPKQRLMAENIKSSSGQMRCFVRAFLANSLADRGLNIKLESVALGGTIARVIEQYADAARVKNISLRMALPVTEIFVQADPPALYQVLDNLISNAIKFSPHRKEVLVTMQLGAAHAECRVQNEGVGFTADDKNRMFQRYVRLSARPTGGEPSTGLGLSIVHRLVQAMNGEIDCESTPNHGTTFTLRLSQMSKFVEKLGTRQATTRLHTPVVSFSRVNASA